LSMSLALENQVRGILKRFGPIVPKGAGGLFEKKVRALVTDYAENERIRILGSFALNESAPRRGSEGHSLPEAAHRVRMLSWAGFSSYSRAPPGSGTRQRHKLLIGWRGARSAR